MRMIPLQLLTIVLLTAGIVSVWLRPPIVRSEERVVVEAAPVVREVVSVASVECDPDEPARVVAQVEKHLACCREHVLVKMRIYFHSIETPRQLKLRFGDDYHVWLSVPPLRESRAGDWDLTLAPRRRP